MLRNLVNYFLVMTNNEKGQGMVEYVLIIGLIAIAIITLVGGAGDAIGAKFTEIVNELTNLQN